MGGEIIRPIHQDEHLGIPTQDIFFEVRRNYDSNMCLALVYIPDRTGLVWRCGNDIEVARIHHGIQVGPTGLIQALIGHYGRNVGYIGVDRIPKYDQLQQRNGKYDRQCGPVTPGL